MGPRITSMSQAVRASLLRACVREEALSVQPGLFDVEARLQRRSDIGDQL